MPKLPGRVRRQAAGAHDRADAVYRGASSLTITHKPAASDGSRQIGQRLALERKAVVDLVVAQRQARNAKHPGSMAVTTQVLTEFAHVVTDPPRFERLLDTAEALELCEQWWNAKECRPVHSDCEAGALFLTWLEEFHPGRKRLLDTLLAASLHCAGVRRIATTDWRDFEAFGVFEVLRLEPV